eukprot:scaffold10178_cov129-Isochrysis_galbana.AAC.3
MEPFRRGHPAPETALLSRSFLVQGFVVGKIRHAQLSAERSPILLTGARSASSARTAPRDGRAVSPG